MCLPSLFLKKNLETDLTFTLDRASPYQTVSCCGFLTSISTTIFSIENVSKSYTVFYMLLTIFLFVNALYFVKTYRVYFEMGTVSKQVEYIAIGAAMGICNPHLHPQTEIAMQ